MIFPALLAAAAAPNPAELKTFGDWAVGCDNGRACHATALVPEEDEWEGRVMLSLKRGAEADAPLRILVPMEEAAKATLAAEGKPLPARLVPGEGGMEVFPTDVPAVLAILRSAKELEVTAAEGGRVSLKGISAALLYMDEQQKRRGTVTALVRPGLRPATAMPPPPPLPRVTTAPLSRKPARSMTKAELDALRRKACDDVGIEDEEGEAETYRLDDRLTLALVPLRCWSGAYNFGSQARVAADKGPWRPARFEPPAGEEPALAMNAGFSPEHRTLGTYSKGRGLGDCGVTQNYAWTGTAFRLVEQAEMDECRGSIDYITTYRAQVMRR